MSGRKPVDESFEDWTERRIREAQARGEFDDLPGAGRPIPGLDRPWSAERWVADLARREGVDLSAALPPSLRLRRERERLLAGLVELRTEAQVRAAVEQFQEQVREAFRRPVTGPPLTVGLLDPDDVVSRWRAVRAEAAEAVEAAECSGASVDPAAATPAEDDPGPGPRGSRRGWWRLDRRRAPP